LTDWTGRTAWLVGASTGIGRATAARLHAQGARVVVSARTAAALDGFVAEHPGSQAIALDATDAEAMHAAAARIGQIDLAVYCAGTYTPMRATEFDLGVALRHQQVNYVGALVMIDAVLPQLLRRREGHLSLVSSVAEYGAPTGVTVESLTAGSAPSTGIGVAARWPSEASQVPVPVPLSSSPAPDEKSSERSNAMFCGRTCTATLSIRPLELLTPRPTMPSFR
jgi:NAD(P)-dependent dehydrogenase (short-subunit alcohol dehydrogenase family)